MAFPSATMATNTKELAMEIPPFVRLYKDGTVERSQSSPIVPPFLQDPKTGVSSKDIVISENPTVSARLYLPKLVQTNEQSKKLPILVYFHGGGFCFESAFGQFYHNYINAFLSHADIIVVSVEYRLAPEHPLPAAYDDCWTSLEWVWNHSSQKAGKIEPWLVDYGDFNKIFIGGDSAGANIVHHMALRARAAAKTSPDGVKIYGAFLSHPYFNSSKPVGSEPVEGFEQSRGVLTWNMVCPSAPAGLDDPMINPMVAGAPDLAGLGCSRMLVCVAGKDLLRDRGILYYEAVKESGWNGELELFEEKGEGHVYHIFNPRSENGMKMNKRLATFILK